MKIEIQLRSQLQHTWATAVETVDTFTAQALKSSLGNQDWLRFFALMGSVLAIKEKTTLVPSTPNNKPRLIEEMRSYATKLDVEDTLHACAAGIQVVEHQHVKQSGADYCLLVLDSQTKQITVTGFLSKDIAQANAEYMRIEREISNKPWMNAVLVSVGAMGSLKRAYPNYFLDTAMFANLVKETLKA